MIQSELAEYCRQRGINYIGRVAERTRRGFYDAYKMLVDSVRTETFLYLEPDHHFFLPYDFVSPVNGLFDRLPDLNQVYLRCPLVYEQPVFVRGCLIRFDGTWLSKVPIDRDNCGWVGRRHTHESFSLAPSICRTRRVREELERAFVPGGVGRFEGRLERRWRGRSLSGYLNSQGFCYHIGKDGKVGPGRYLAIGDVRYEAIWGRKILDPPRLSRFDEARVTLLAARMEDSHTRVATGALRACVDPGSHSLMCGQCARLTVDADKLPLPECQLSQARR